MKRSFTNLLLFYILGILIFHYVEITSNFIFIMFILSIVYLSYNIIKLCLNQSVLLCFFLMLGIFISSLNSNGYLEQFVGEEISLEARVLELDKKTSEIGKYLIEVKKSNNNKIAKEKAILTVIGEKNLKLGSTIIFKTIPKLPKENTNPGLFNYKLHLKGKKIYTTITVNSNLIETVNTSSIPFRYRLKENTIEKVENIFKDFLNEENNSLISSIILGNSSYLSEENVELYRDMGLAHILAVSGLHIGIISSFLMFLISRLGIKRKTNVVLTLVFIWSYGFIIGYPASILRGSILFSFLYLSRIIHKPYNSLNILSLAALILLIVNPYSLFSVSFQLSFIASASIIIFTPRITYLLYPLKGKFINTVSSLTAVNLGLGPLQAYYFNKISIIGFLANLIILPILSFSLILAFIMIGFNFIIPNLNSFLGVVLNKSLNLQFAILRIIEKFPINTIRVPSPEIISIFLIFLFISIIFEIIDLKRLDKKILRVIMIYLILLLAINIINIKDNMEIHFIDVGQGDSIYIRSGKKDILIDTGGSIFKNYNISKNTVLPYLEKIGVRKLDAIFISHFHEDHCQGVPLLLNEFKIDHIFASHKPTEEYMELLDDDRFTFLKKGDNIKIDRDTSFEIIWPVDEMDYEDNLNNTSMVGILKNKDLKILFTGDMERKVEDALLEDMEKIDILKVAHHGSNTSSTPDFIDKVDPNIGVISVGQNNTFNHPSEEVINRLKEKGQVFSTDENGLIKIIIDKDYQVIPYLKDGEKDRVTIEDYLLGNHNNFLFNVLFFIIIYILIKRFMKEDLKNEL